MIRFNMKVALRPGSWARAAHVTEIESANATSVRQFTESSAATGAPSDFCHSSPAKSHPAGPRPRANVAMRDFRARGTVSVQFFRTRFLVEMTQAVLHKTSRPPTAARSCLSFDFSRRMAGESAVWPTLHRLCCVTHQPLVDMSTLAGECLIPILRGEGHHTREFLRKASARFRTFHAK